MRREEKKRRDERRDGFVEKCLKTTDFLEALFHNDSKKIPVGRIIRSKVQNLTSVFNYLPDSNSNFRPARLNFRIIFMVSERSFQYVQGSDALGIRQSLAPLVHNGFISSARSFNNDTFLFDSHAPNAAADSAAPALLLAMVFLARVRFQGVCLPSSITLALDDFRVSSQSAQSESENVVTSSTVLP